MKDKTAVTHPNLNIKNIISDDGTIHEYAQFWDPDYPDDLGDRIQVKEYTAKLNMSLKKRDDYRSDRLIVASKIHSHVGTDSGARVIKENLSLAPGDTKDLDDPLLKVVADNSSQGRKRKLIMLDDAMKAFTNISMNQEETVTNFTRNGK